MCSVLYTPKGNVLINQINRPNFFLNMYLYPVETAVPNTCMSRTCDLFLVHFLKLQSLKL